MAVSLGMVIALIKKFGGGGGGGGGGVTDVKVNGVSVVSGGKANIPIAGVDALGTVKVNQAYGIAINEEGRIFANSPSVDMVKEGTSSYRPIVPARQHQAVFYGLAKVAGSDEASSALSTGVYSENAKSAISQMLDAPETISGTTPSITGKAGVRYICGEVSTISITPPASGAVDVVFESGSTPAVLTVPSTVKFPAWFDADNLEANKTYEINILDGVYGVVTSWA